METNYPIISGTITKIIKNSKSGLRYVLLLTNVVFENEDINDVWIQFQNKRLLKLFFTLSRHEATFKVKGIKKQKSGEYRVREIIDLMDDVTVNILVIVRL